MTGPDPDSTIATVLDDVRSQLGATGVFVSMIMNGRHMIIADSMDTPLGEDMLVLPLDYSICQHAAAMGVPLAIEDAAAHPLARRTKAVTELGVGAYLGVPIYVGSEVAAVVCAMEWETRGWRKVDIGLMEEAARRTARLLVAGFGAAQGHVPVVTGRRG